MNKDKNYWLDLAERYFEAALSEDEEMELKRFVASTDGIGDHDFDELRAVMGIVAAAKTRDRRMPRWVLPAAAAIVIGFLLLVPGKERNVCVAYIDGQAITDPQRVMQLVHSSWDDIALDENDSGIEAEMQDMFDLTTNQ